MGGIQRLPLVASDCRFMAWLLLAVATCNPRNGMLDPCQAWIVVPKHHRLPGAKIPRGAGSHDGRYFSSTGTKTTTTATATTTTTALSMNFVSDFFENLQKTMNTGGSYNLGIDYESLEYPGPEVGRLAVAMSTGETNTVPSTPPSKPHLEMATLAGGCFWGLELALQRTEGVEHTLVGYTQGPEARPNYEQVSAGNTGHCEAVMVYFDPARLSYEGLLSTVFLDRVDVTTRNGQGKDFGKQYRTGIYFHTSQQEDVARELLAREVATNPRYAAGGKSVVVATEVLPAKAFWPAEAYHQRYLEKGGRFGNPQSAAKGNRDEIRCYG